MFGVSLKVWKLGGGWPRPAPSQRALQNIVFVLVLATFWEKAHPTAATHELFWPPFSKQVGVHMATVRRHFHPKNDITK